MLLSQNSTATALTTAVCTVWLMRMLWIKNPHWFKTFELIWKLACGKLIQTFQKKRRDPNVPQRQSGPIRTERKHRHCQNNEPLINKQFTVEKSCKTSFFLHFTGQSTPKTGPYQTQLYSINYGKEVPSHSLGSGQTNWLVSVKINLIKGRFCCIYKWKLEGANVKCWCKSSSVLRPSLSKYYIYI